ncbi:MAG: hypothetical protein GF364_12110 [Candidatus Lokiarchaeota archaeon]|nr:hypothetical protein [Candidatus Lokiarchaeota archaeon]
MKKIGIVYDDIFAEHHTQGWFSHPECKERVLHTIDVLKEHEMYGKDHAENYVPIMPRDATFEELNWCHEQALIEWVKDAVSKSSEKRLEHMDGDTPVSPQSLNAALQAAGGNFEAIDKIMEGKINRAFVLCRPPGHHANKGRSRGFCLFNNIILATHYLTRKKGIKKVAIFDFDVHAGNGSEDLIWRGIPEGEVLFISSHQDPRAFYPFECHADEIGDGAQKGKIVNITYAPGSGDQCINLALDEIVSPLFREFKPEFILISAGFDAHHTDPIGGLGFTDQSYGNMINKLSPIADEFASGRMAATLEGGYNIDSIARSISNVISTMSTGKLIEDEDEFQEKSDRVEYTENVLIPKIQGFIAPYWKSI